MLSLFIFLYVLIIAIFKTIVFFICAISVFFDNMLNKIKSNQADPTCLFGFSLYPQNKPLSFTVRKIPFREFLKPLHVVLLLESMYNRYNRYNRVQTKTKQREKEKNYYSFRFISIILLEKTIFFSFLMETSFKTYDKKVCRFLYFYLYGYGKFSLRLIVTVMFGATFLN